MENRARDLKQHYIVCGIGSVGLHVVNELHATSRPFVVIDIDKNDEKILDPLKEAIFLEGDATDDDLLLKAGIKQAKGLFAVTNDDNENLAICLTARQLSPSLRIAACCNEPRNANKLTRAGADAVVSPGLIGGLRIASEMIRPTVVSFLDIMLRDKEKNLRVEEITVPASFSGETISSLGLKKHRNILLLALKTRDDWIYNPSDDHIIGPVTSLIIMTDVAGREDLENFFQADRT